MNAIQNRPRRRWLQFILETSKLFGIAIVSLLVIAVVVIVSVKTGIMVPARWVGLFFWTCFLLWFIFRQHKRDLRDIRFWIALLAFIAIHIAAYTTVLRAYPAWRMVWFMLISMIEGPLVLVVFGNFIHPGRNRKHV